MTFKPILGDGITLSATLIILGAAVGLGVAISLVYMFTHRSEGYVPSFIITLVLLPAVCSSIILLVGSNVAWAFSLAGTASLVRFRSAPGSPKDLAYLFFGLGIGLACGSGYVLYALVFTCLLCAVLLVFDLIKFGQPKNTALKLRITVPEDLNFEGIFDDVLKKYTDKFTMTKLRTTDFGTLYELVYVITLKKGISRKEFIDELRTRNGNLNITMSMYTEEERASV
ncbi:MAG: DUF4956 domain-containing protein [Eubacteriales bacterium]